MDPNLFIQWQIKSWFVNIQTEEKSTQISSHLACFTNKHMTWSILTSCFLLRRMGFRRRHIKSPVSWLMASPGCLLLVFPSLPAQAPGKYSNRIHRGEPGPLHPCFLWRSHARMEKIDALICSLGNLRLRGGDRNEGHYFWVFGHCLCMNFNFIHSMALMEHL